MGLFGFGRKKAEKPACACGGGNEAGESRIKVLGSGCKSCHALFESTRAAVERMGLPIAPAYITDLEQIMAYGAMSMPALVVDEKVVSAGRMLKPDEVEALLRSLGL